MKALKQNTINTMDIQSDFTLGQEEDQLLLLAQRLEQNNSLKKLTIRKGNGINAEGGGTLADVLRVNTTLQMLNLNGNEIGEQGGQAFGSALEVNKTLSELHLSGNKICGIGCRGLAKVLDICGLTVLDLSGNLIDVEATVCFAKALNKSRLTGLYFSCNDVFFPGAHAFGEALKSNSTLRVLHLKKCGIGKKAIPELAKALKFNDTLTELHLSHNPDISSAQAKLLANAITINAGLTRLDLSHCSIDDEGVESFAKSLSTAENRRIAFGEHSPYAVGSTAENTTLEELNISGNPYNPYTSASARHTISELLAHNRNAKASKTPGNNCTAQSNKSIRDESSEKDLAAAETPHKKPKNRKYVRSKNRWADGIDVTAAGARDFFPAGWIPRLDVRSAIKVFGHSDRDLDELARMGEYFADFLKQFGVTISAQHATTVYAYTEERPTNLYGRLNLACRTPGDAEIAVYRDYLHFLMQAAAALPNFCGMVYRGMGFQPSPELYAPEKKITWQQFSSASKQQRQASTFCKEVVPGQLHGSMYVISVKTGKQIGKCSQYPEEEEILLQPNSFFETGNVVSNDEKAKLLADLSAYDLTHLHVYQLTGI